MPYNPQGEHNVAEKIRVLGAGGGYLCSPAHIVQADTSMENVEAFIAAVKKQSLCSRPNPFVSWVGFLAFVAGCLTGVFNRHRPSTWLTDKTPGNRTVCPSDRKSDADSRRFPQIRQEN